MRLILYAPTSSKKDQTTTHGLGHLRETTACTITETENGPYELSLNYPLNGQLASELVKYAVIRANEQLFRIYKVVKSEANQSITISANHIFYDLEDGFIEDSRAVDCTMGEALEVAIPDQFNGIFTTSSDILDVNSRYLVKKSGREAVFYLIKRWGLGQLIRDNYHVAINHEKAKESRAIFTYRKVKDVNYETDSTEVVTHLYPVGRDGLTLPEKYMVVPQWDDGSTIYPHQKQREVTFEDVEDVQTLRELAQKEAETIGLASESLVVTPEDLLTGDELVEVGDWVTVKHPDLDIRALVKVVKRTLDLVNDTYTLELGDLKAGLNDYSSTRISSSVQTATNNLKTQVRQYSNDEDVEVLQEERQLSKIDFAIANDDTAEAEAIIQFWGIASTGGTKLHILMRNGEEVFDYTPQITLNEGSNAFNAVIPILNLKRTDVNSLTVHLMVEAGTFTIDRQQYRFILRGSCLSAAEGSKSPDTMVESRYELGVKDVGTIGYSNVFIEMVGSIEQELKSTINDSAYYYETNMSTNVMIYLTQDE